MQEGGSNFAEYLPNEAYMKKIKLKQSTERTKAVTNLKKGKIKTTLKNSI